MKVSRKLHAGVVALAALLSALASRAAGPSASAAADPLRTEIERWSSFLRSNTSTDEKWTQVKQSSGPALSKAEQALADGHRFLALHRLAAARINLAASAYVAEHRAEKNDDAKLETEWSRTGAVLARELAVPAAATFEGLHPAALRAQAEAALPQVRAYYEASVEYARSTMAEWGFFYLGAALGQRDFVDFCRRLGSSSELREPPLRALGGEIDALESLLLDAYRPPASIDRHSEFIAANATIKEARELDARGLRYGALLRYLQALVRVAVLRPAPGAPLGADALAERLREIETRLSSGGVDHSVGTLFVELARTELASPTPGTRGSVAETIVREVFPRYFEALAPAPARPAPVSPALTVTLVRWPYT